MKLPKKYIYIAAGIILFGLLQVYIIQVAYHYQEAYYHGLCIDEIGASPIHARNVWTFQTKGFKNYCHLPRGWYETSVD